MQSIFTIENIYGAYCECRKNKTNTSSHKDFLYNLEENLYQLQYELVNGKYEPERSVAFIVRKPKLREVFAASFRDRVVHHLLCGYLSPIYEKVFIYDSLACRPGKGTMPAMKRLRKMTVACEKQSYGKSTYYLKLDIKSYFTSINQAILYSLLEKKTKNKEVLWLAKLIISHDCARDIKPVLRSSPELFKKLPADKSLFTVKKGNGLPIGNLTSQFFANVYLNELDQYVKHALKIKHYIRYVDDFVILGTDKKELIDYQQKITNFLSEKLLLTVHPDKIILKRISSGIDFVGYIIRPSYILIRNRIIATVKSKLEYHYNNPSRSKEILNSFFAHSKWANCQTFNMRLTEDMRYLVYGGDMRKWNAVEEAKITNFVFFNDYSAYFGGKPSHILNLTQQNLI